MNRIIDQPIVMTALFFRCFTTKLFQFEGRASRREYSSFILGYLTVGMTFILISRISFQTLEDINVQRLLLLLLFLICSSKKIEYRYFAENEKLKRIHSVIIGGLLGGLFVFWISRWFISEVIALVGWEILSSIISMIGSFWTLVMSIASGTVITRRLHDLNLSSWWMWGALISAMLIFITINESFPSLYKHMVRLKIFWLNVLISLPIFFMKGNLEANKYGKPPIY